MATLTRDAVTIAPELVLGWAQTRESRTVMHAILSRPDPDVTLRPSAYPSGTLSLYFGDLVDALAAVAEHADTPGVWTYDAAPEQPELVGAYVVSGPVSYRADGSDLDVWVVDVTYQEVAP